jgi:hypothetical protein
MFHSASDMASPCEHGNESSGHIKDEEILDWLSDC